MEKYVNIMLDKAFKTVFGEKQVAIWISELAHRCGAIKIELSNYRLVV